MKLGEAMKGYKPVKMANIVTLDSDELPDIKNWKPGQRYRIVLDVEQVNMRVGSSDYGAEPNEKSDKNEVHASFRIIAARPQYGGGPVKQSSGKPDKSATMKALAAKAV